MGRFWDAVRLVLGCVLLGTGMGLPPVQQASGEPARFVSSPFASQDSLTARQVSFVLRYGAELPPPPPEDRWLGRDKALHVAFSALWTLSTQYVLTEKAAWTRGRALPISIGSAAALGLGKELYDARRAGKRGSAKDLVADAVGIGLAVTVIVL